MTSNKESSDRALPAWTDGGIETLGGVVHPFDIEVQDFDVYALVLDVRGAAEYAQDHVPGAVRLPPEDGPPVQPLQAAESGVAITPAPGIGLPPPIEVLLARLKPNAQVLVYCGRGGRDSLPVASGLRARGLTVDVLPGGWINYRRWVIAGMGLLPRMIAFKMLSTALGIEAQQVLAVLTQLGHQVVDLDELAGQAQVKEKAQPQAQTPNAASVPQAYFESLLLKALRALDPRQPVWVADAGFRLNGLELPVALREVLDRCPVARLLVPENERLALDHDADRVKALVRLAYERADTHAVQLPALEVTSFNAAALVSAIQRWAKPVELNGS
jgi:tRNA 2-selenouridine synthase